MTGSYLDLLLLPPAVASLAVLLFCGQRPGNLRVIRVFKPLTSALYVLTALWRGPGTRYDWLVVAGLVLSMAGDVLLIRRERSWLLAGLVAFLIGHVAYLMAFGTRAALLALQPAAMAALAALGLVVFVRLRPYLGRLPVARRQGGGRLADRLRCHALLCLGPQRGARSLHSRGRVRESCRRLDVLLHGAVPARVHDRKALT